MSNLRINTSCAVSTANPPGGPLCPTPEPRPSPSLPILALDSTSTAGTTCPGGPFTFAGPDVSGDYTISPNFTTLGGQQVCDIAVTFDVVQRPLDGATFQVVGALFIVQFPDFQSGASMVVVNPAAPSLSTVASASPGPVPVGTEFSDTATVTGVANGPTPTGTVTFTTFADPPGAPPCSGPSTTFAPVSLAGPAPTPPTPPTATATSASVTATPGTYRFVASYSGDANYAALPNSACGAPGENVVVSQLQLTLATQASTNASDVSSGTVVTDVATLTPPPGGPVPTGTVTYTLIGPNPDAECTGPVVGASTVPAGSQSEPFTVILPGTYNFVATYSGDANYLPITTRVGCGVPAEMFAVITLPIGLSTQASTNALNVAPGTAVSDTAILTPPAGGPTPTGTVTYTLVGPNPSATCTGPVIGIPSTVPVGSPSAPYIVTAPGTYNFVATYSGDANYSAITTPVGCGVPNEMFAVALQSVPFATQASTNSTTVAPGTDVTDMATFTPPAGAPTPTGTVTYTLVGPNPDPSCIGPVVGSSTVPVGVPSAPFTVSAPGSYNFVATYSGDPFYAPVITPVGCGVPAEMFTVATLPVAMATQASTNAPNVAPGTAVSDTAIVTPPAGGPTPTGTVTYTLVGPNPDAACIGPVIGSSTVPVGQGSAPFTVATPGTYNFVATYSGDPNYSPITTPVGCGDPAERFTVARSPVSIVTQASPPVPVGGQISDTATLSGGVAPTGTITFTLFGPDNATCTGAPVFTSVIPVNGNGNYTSGAHTTDAAGTYRWVATYSGDASNAPAGPTACLDPLEATAGLKVTPALVTVASGGGIGEQVSDTAALSGGFNPTGTITFQLFANETCTGTPLFTNTRPVTGNGNVVSDPFIIPGPGIYHFVATYSGDANNNPVGPTACLDPLETVAVGRVPVSVATVASPSVPAGGVIFAAATAGGGLNPTGSITFSLFGPDNATCSGTPVFTSTVPVNGNGSYPSASFTATAPGTYRWVAAYSGDPNNAPAVTACGDPLAQVVVKPRPVIVVDNTATPESRPAPGGTFTFTVVVTNATAAPVTITSLNDDVYGSVTIRPGSTCNTAIGTVLAASPGPGNTYACSFQGEFVGPSGASQADTVTAVATDPEGITATDSDDAIVRITPAPPSISTTKGATPPSLPEPGGPFTFDYSVTNTGLEPVTVTSIVDDVYGNLNARGTCAVGILLASGATYACSFTGNFFGDARARQTDTIVTTAVDGRGQSVTSLARTTVTITDVAPSIRVAVDATPVPEPGGGSTVTVTVTNTSFEPVTLVALTDTVHGNLDGRGTCAVGVRLAPANGIYTCSFPISFVGDAGSSRTHTVTATVMDDDGTSVSAAGTATLRVIDVPPTVSVDMQPVNPTLPAPGGEFVYRIVVTNSSSEPVTVVSVAVQPPALGNCASGVAIAPNGGTYTCFLVRTFTGGPGASQTDRVTVVVVDNEGSRAVATDDATVTITAAPPGAGGTTTSTSTSTTSTSTTSTTTTMPSTTTTTLPPSVTVPQETTTSVVPATTTTPAPTTTTVTPTTVAPTTVAPTTVATTEIPTTVAPIPTTAPTLAITAPPAVTSTPTTAPALAPTTTAAVTTTAPATTTTVPPTTTPSFPATTTTVPGPPVDTPSLDAVNPEGERSGPPGVGLDVSGGGYQGCSRVYVFFDGVRIGTVDPDDAGFIGVGDLSVPGDAEVGEHRVTSSCRSSGAQVRASTTFTVTDAEFHRTAFVTSLPNPDQISLEMERILASAAVAGLVILLFAFPSKLFNSAVEEHYDEIRGWFRLPARAVEAASATSRTVSFVVLSVLAAVALGFLSPDFGLDLNSAVLVTGFTLSLIAMSAGFSIPAAIGIHRRTGEWGKLNFLPGTLLVSVFMVVLCRVLKIQPGYFYGAVAGIAFASALNQKTQGRLVAANWTWALTLSLAAWFLRMPVSEVAAEPDASVLWIGVEAFLVMTFLWGVESLAVAMLPMRFLDGPKVKAWNRPVWAALLFVGVFATVHVLLTPTAGYVGQTTEEVTWDVLVVFAAFGAFSLAVWSYFRYRPRRWIPGTARSG